MECNKRSIHFQVISILTLITGLLFSGNVSSQDGIDQQVVVVRSYEHTVRDAAKINFMPELTDTINFLPVFSYSIFPVPLVTDFSLMPISPARTSTEPVSDLSAGHLRFGMGSYLSPFIELNINNLRHNRFAGGLFIHHHSSQARVKLDNDERAHSRHADNNVLLYGKRMGEKSIISADMALRSDGFHFYGYDTSIDTLFDKNDIKQNFTHFNTSINLNSANRNPESLNYQASLIYNYFKDLNELSETGVVFKLGMDKYFRNQTAGADFMINYNNHSFISDTSNTVFVLSPWFRKADDEWEINAGFHGYLDIRGDNSSYYFHPKASIQFAILSNYVIPFFGIDGKLNVNNYRSVAYNNQFITPGLYVENSNESMELYTGVKGNFTRNIAFNLRFSYSVIDNNHFFINDPLNSVANKFAVVYDDVELIKYLGEFSADISRSLSFNSRIIFSDYNTKYIEHPWHMPKVDLNFSAVYNFRDKMRFNADIFYIGERYALDMSNQAIILKGVTDINLGAEYKYNRSLSAFLKVNNLANSRYYRWNNYPLQGFSIMGGFTYTL